MRNRSLMDVAPAGFGPGKGIVRVGDGLGARAVRRPAAAGSPASGRPSTGRSRCSSTRSSSRPHPRSSRVPWLARISAIERSWDCVQTSKAVRSRSWLTSPALQRGQGQQEVTRGIGVVAMGHGAGSRPGPIEAPRAISAYRPHPRETRPDRADDDNARSRRAEGPNLIKCPESGRGLGRKSSGEMPPALEDSGRSNFARFLGRRR